MGLFRAWIERLQPRAAADIAVALPPWTQLRRAIADGVVVGLSCLLTYWLATTILAHVYSPSAADDELGGLWAVIATVFVLRGDL